MSQDAASSGRIQTLLDGFFNAEQRRRAYGDDLGADIWATEKSLNFVWEVGGMATARPLSRNVG